LLKIIGEGFWEVGGINLIWWRNIYPWFTLYNFLAKFWEKCPFYLIFKEPLLGFLEGLSGDFQESHMGLSSECSVGFYSKERESLSGLSVAPCSILYFQTSWFGHSAWSYDEPITSLDLSMAKLKWYPFTVENDRTRLIPHNRISTVNRRAVSLWKKLFRKSSAGTRTFFLNNFSIGKGLCNSWLRFCCEGWAECDRFQQ